MSIEIHEFSTGIRAEKTANGGWVSLGFTGQYMNCTLERIPEAVERSIANREFAVTEGASTEQPAIIGRVLGTGEDAWSVMAVVTRGRDEKGRSVSVYRYFLCQGDKNLRLLIADWENQNKPTFKPSDHKSVGQSHSFDGSSSLPHLPLEAKELPFDQPQPILLLPEQRYDLATINTLALRKFNTNNNGQPVSWAFNVEALKQPHRFQVIQPASDRAYQILQRAIAHVPQVSAPVVVDEEALKSALRSLMNSSQVKPEAVQVIAEALGNQQITSKYWHSLFDGQGAATAIKQKIYTSQMVRLVTLRAMVIPETLPEFLAWLNVKEGKNENRTISLEFQDAAAIRDVFPKDKLLAGLKLIIPKLLKPNDITPEVMYWLIKENGGAWFAVQNDFIEQILSDLQLIHKTIEAKAKIDKKSFNFEHTIWEELISSHSRSQNSDYEPLAELFSYLEKYKISAYFYQVSYGVVPQNIFIKAFPNSTGRYRKFAKLGLTLKKELSLVEKIIYFLLQEFIVPIQIVIPLVFVVFMGGLMIGSKKNSNQSDHTQPTTAEPKINNSSKIYNSPPLNPPNIMADEIKKEAIRNLVLLV
ncbi:MAG: hypothetical protein ICV54_22640 [Nostoc sp. C3-bin3]|nr:hypothetical protein [Nostoc sp. C3-bin3]